MRATSGLVQVLFDLALQCVEAHVVMSNQEMKGRTQFDVGATCCGLNNRNLKLATSQAVSSNALNLNRSKDARTKREHHLATLFMQTPLFSFHSEMNIVV